ncbi:hypothetical protein [Hymenobacter sp. YC55]|uniref:hypothetical protein n=1 Tax=Hymenobacter sp. YC55 TaxID=3034019 RepID=UPI0023F76E08|nr:hypothetical protein [Hymenobacter sp. YC55]MDF7810708.1 hypothetical protein [Hymenobacter sp. YC55]
MFNSIKLAALLAATIGYRSSYAGSPDEPVELPATLKAADDSLAVQEIHPLLTLRNIRQAAPQMTELGFVKYLDQQRKTAALQVLQAFQEKRQLTGTGKRLLQDLPLTEASGQYRNKIIRQGRFVGLALRPKAGHRDIAIRITAVGTQFTERVPDFTLSVFHSSDMTTPVKEVKLPRLDRVYFEWTQLEEVIDLSTKKGGTWYIGYYEDKMSAQAIRLDQNLQLRPGQCCGNAYVQYDKWSPYVQVLPFSQATPTAEVAYQSDTNWGLNLRLEASCDLTTYLSGQLPAFASAFQLQLGVNLLKMMAHNTRDNGLADETKALALLELNNRTNSQEGMLTRLETALKAVDADLSGITSICMPCAPKPAAIKFSAL